MATGDSLSGDQVKIWLTPANTNGSDFTSSDEFQMEVTDFNQSGGERDVESISVFGGGYINRRIPQEQIEISLDVILRYGPDADRWDKILDGTTEVGQFAIQATDGTNYYWRAYNNLSTTNFEAEFSAEEEWRGTINFKISPATADADTNYKYGTDDIKDPENGLVWD